MGHHHVRVEISADRPEIGRIMLSIPPDTSKLFPKKISTFVRTHSGGILKFVFLVLALKIAYFGKVLLLLRFWVPRCCFLKKLIQSQSFQKSIWSMGLFPAFKKLYHFEIPMGYCYSPLDGSITYTHRKKSFHEHSEEKKKKKKDSSLKSPPLVYQKIGSKGGAFWSKYP